MRAGVTAHDGDHLVLVEPAQELPHRVADGPVVHRPAQGLADVIAVHPLFLVVSIDPGVEARRIGILVLGIIAGVQAFPIVQLASEGVVDTPQPGKHQTGTADVPFHFGGDLTAEEAAVGEAVSGRHILRDLVEVYVLESIAGDEARLVRSGKQGDIRDFLVRFVRHRLL